MTNSSIFIMGPPGSGKTTLIESIKKDFTFFDICLGDIFRNILNGDDNVLKEKLYKQLKSNNFFDKSFVSGIIEKNILQNLDKNLLIEGVKNYNEVEALCQFFKKYNLPIKSSIILYCDENISRKRVDQRGSRNHYELSSHFRRRIEKFFSEKDKIIETLKNVSDKTIIIDSTRLSVQEVYSIFKEQVLVGKN